MSESEQDYKKQPFWIVNAHTEEFIAGASTEPKAKLAVSALNRAAHGVGTSDRYRVMEPPPVVNEDSHQGLTATGDVPPDGGY